jgi:UDPglucose 6-dehydrogenase
MNENQKRSFASRVTSCLFSTLTRKKIAVFGFAFKKDTGDTRESPAITLCKHFREEAASIAIYDPKVPESQIWLDLAEPGNPNDLAHLQKQVRIAKSAYSACEGADAVVVCTEWDEFRTTQLDYKTIYDSMRKPAFIFDGRLILDQNVLKKIGFHVETIGRPRSNFRTTTDFE